MSTIRFTVSIYGGNTDRPLACATFEADMRKDMVQKIVRFVALFGIAKTKIKEAVWVMGFDDAIASTPGTFLGGASDRSHLLWVHRA